VFLLPPGTIRIRLQAKLGRLEDRGRVARWKTPPVVELAPQTFEAKREYFTSPL
jgi:hypothetical protein